MSAGAPFSNRVVAIAATVAASSFLLAFLFSGRGDDWTSPRDLGASTYSYTAIGHRAFHEWVGRRGLEPSRRRSGFLTRAAPDVAIVSLAPGAGRWVGEIDDGRPSLATLELDAYNVGGPLVVAPRKWFGLPGLGRPDRVQRVRRLPTSDVEADLDAFLHYLHLPKLLLQDVDALTGCRDGSGRTFAVEIDEPRVLVPAEPVEDGTPPVGFEATVACDQGILVGTYPASESSATLHLFADIDLLNNQGIGRGDHVDLLDATFGEAFGVVGLEIDETLHGHGRSTTLLSELLRFPLVLLTVQGLLLLAVVVWHGMRRFGRTAPPAPSSAGDGRHVLVDNAARLLDLLGHSRASLEAYYRATLRAVGRSLFVEDGLPAAELESRVRQLTRHRESSESIDAIRAEVEAFRESSRRADRALKIARRLFRWRREITGAH